MNQEYRFGRYTSSTIWKLMGSKKVRETYIKEKKYEKKLRRSLNTDTSARATTWGKVVESYVFDILPLDYQLSSQVTLQHETIPYFAGSPDGVKKNVVYDIKCPYTLKSFCELSEIQTIEDLKEEYPEYYWQLVSNSILTGCTHAELIIFCPYTDELEKIKDICGLWAEPNKVAWIVFAEDNDLPNIPRDSEFKNLNIFSFEVPEEDKIKLIETIKEYPI